MFFNARRLFTVLLVSAGLGLACDDSGDDDGGGDEGRIASTCQTYCAKAHTCDDDKTVEQCVADCKAQLGDCMADEQDQVLDDLDSCAADACDEFTGCTIGAGLQCTFGI
jgi:hypothetical protein